MNVFVLYSNADSKGRHDATGAFIPEARAFKKIHGIPDVNFVGMDCVSRSLTSRRDLAFRILEEAGKPEPIDLLAIYGHGWPSGLQCGITIDAIPRFVNILARNSSPSLRVVLYACLTAENEVRDDKDGEVGPATDGGFADLLRDEMVRKGLDGGWVDGHKTAGHATINPFVVRFYCQAVEDPEFGAVGGTWLVQPRSAFWKAWVRALRDPKGLRHRFPIMTEEEIFHDLRSP